MQPLISVIVPSYNHEAYLRECLESVLWQSFREWELILIDDCSADQSLQVARRFDDPRVRIYENRENLGAYATENVGLDLAQGQWIAILNSDDLWLPRKLEMQMSLLERHPECGFSYTSSQLIDEDGNRIKGDTRFHGGYPTSPVQDLRPYLIFENRVLASSLVFRKSAVRFHPLLRYSGDWVALLELSSKTKAAYVDEPLTAWRQHPENSYTKLMQVLPEEIAVREAILGRFSAEAAHGEEVRRQLSRCAVALAALYLRSGRRVLARRAAKKAMALDPTNRRALSMSVLSIVPGNVARRRLWGESKPLQLDLNIYRGVQVFPSIS